MKRFYVFIPRKDGGWKTHSFDTRKEAEHFASLFKDSHIKEMA